MAPLFMEALAAGEETKVTPATVQLLASVESGSLKATLNPRLNAAMVFSSPIELAVPVSKTDKATPRGSEAVKKSL